MMDRPDPMIEAVRRAGDVPPPPAREEARARAMASIAEYPLRRRLTKVGVTLLAAALLAVPAGVITVRARTPDSPAIQSEESASSATAPLPQRSHDEKAVSTAGGHDDGDEDRRDSHKADESRENENEAENGDADDGDEVEHEGEDGEDEEIADDEASEEDDSSEDPSGSGESDGGGENGED